MLELSIITATFNASETIVNCLESVAAQSSNVEHIIIDGVSTDNTAQLVEQYTSHPVKLVSQPDLGIYDAMNKGIAMATGEVVGILNADDFYSSNDVLAKVSEVFSDPKVDACYGDLKYVDEHDVGKTIRYWKSGVYEQRKFYSGWMPPHPTFFVRRSIYEKYGMFNLDLGTAADYELMLRLLLKHSINAVYIPDVLVKMRTGGKSNLSISNRLKANRMDRRAWSINGLKPYPWTIPLKPLRKIPQWFFRE